MSKRVIVASILTAHACPSWNMINGLPAASTPSVSVVVKYLEKISNFLSLAASQVSLNGWLKTSITDL